MVFFTKHIILNNEQDWGSLMHEQDWLRAVSRTAQDGVKGKFVALF